MNTQEHMKTYTINITFQVVVDAPSPNSAKALAIASVTAPGPAYEDHLTDADCIGAEIVAVELAPGYST